MSAWKEIPTDKDARRLAVIVLLIVGLLLLQPWLWGQVFDAAANFRDRQTQQQQLANVKRLIEMIRAVNPAKQSLLDQAEVAFPQSDAASLIVERLEALAQAQGLTLALTSITEQPKNSVKKHELAPFEVSLAVAGSPESLLGYLDAIEHMQEFTEVRSWDIKALPTTIPASKVYKLTVTVRLFLQPSS